MIQQYNLAVDTGAFVVTVASGSPADDAGLKVGDVITSFAGKEMNTVDDLIQAIRSAEIGQKVEITYWRGETQKTTSATLIESPPSS